MKRKNTNFLKQIGVALALITHISLLAQNTIQGKITDQTTGTELVGVNILVKNTVIGTVTNYNGDYSLDLSKYDLEFPLTLSITYVGFTSQEIEVTQSTSQLDVSLEESNVYGEEIVIAASRKEESSFRSPVTIEKLDILDIKQSASPDFYSSLKNLNGIDVSAQSLTFKSINVRGFASNGNVRFVQLIDGVDNQAPGLNFPVGNVVGISELDLESVEIIPGAASALYGPNALQGILLMKSKSPFDYRGLDAYVKFGVNDADENKSGLDLYKDIGFRYANALNDRFAFKVNFSFLSAQDFVANDTRDQSGSSIEGNLNSTRANNRFYDGVNIYGDFPITMRAIADGAAQDNSLIAAIAPLFPDGVEGLFSPTGYAERDFVDNKTESLKLGLSAHYRLSKNVELIGQFNWGLGSSVYTATDRFILDNFGIWRGKLELRGSNFYLRGYTTKENSGDAYAANTIASLVNQEHYLPTYFGAWAGALQSGVNPTDYTTLHQLSRTAADAAQPQPGSETFNSTVERLKNTPISEGGAKFIDNSALWHYEGSYRFENIDFIDIVVGGNFRIYDLNSEGTLFAKTDDNKEVSLNERGAYVQVGKDVTDKIKVQASIRYDKNQNFDGQFSPRVSGVWEFLDGHNFRASYQSAFRMPAIQDQYIDLDVVTRRLLGRNTILRTRYNIDSNPVYTTQSVIQSQASGNVGDLVVATDAYNSFEMEKVNSVEFGYKSLLFNDKLYFDIFYYASNYQNFNAEIDITQAVSVANIQNTPLGYNVGTQSHTDAQKSVFVEGGTSDISLQRYGYDISLQEDLKSHGLGFKVNYSLLYSFNIGANASYNKLKSADDLLARNYNIAYNTPDWRYNISFGNRRVTKLIGFGINYRWQNAFLWQSPIGSAIIPAYGTIDAQVTYQLPKLNGSVKIGGSNIFNNKYTTSLANPAMGSIYYVQLNFDNILKN